MSGIELGDESRRLYEQIGALYYAMSEADAYNINGSGSVESFADLLDTVQSALALGHFSDLHNALGTAIRRYERDRTGGRPDTA